MLTPLMGTIIPSSVNQIVSSSGPPAAMQAIMALVTSGLSKEQAEEIFLLACEAWALGRKLTHDY